MKLWLKSLLMFLAIIVVTAGAGVVYVSTVLNSTTSTLKSTFTNVGNKNTEQAVKATQPLTILLMGVDTGGQGRGTSDSWDGNADSEILMTLNPKTKTTTMVSMERDTLSNILDGNGNVISQTPTKLNSAYPSGYNNGGFDSAVSYAMKTVGVQGGVDIGNFVTMNFDGLINLVNDVGGISIVNDSGGVDALNGTSQGQKVTLPSGETVDSGAIYISDTEPEYSAYVPYYSDNREQVINGEQALVYARDRHTLGNGDYGRAAHQREVIAAVMKKILSADNLTQYQKFLNDISKDFKTNIPISASTISSFLGYKDCFNKVVSVQYEGVGYTGTDGGSYQLTPQNAALAVQNVMKKSLGQATSDQLDSNMVTYESYTGNSPSSSFLPSATVTQNGKSTTYGVDVNGNLVTIDSSNSGTYVSTNGSAVTSTAPPKSGTDASSSSAATSDNTAAADGTGTTDGTTATDGTGTADSTTDQGGGATTSGTPVWDPTTGQYVYQ